MKKKSLIFLVVILLFSSTNFGMLSAQQSNDSLGTKNDPIIYVEDFEDYSIKYEEWTEFKDGKDVVVTKKYKKSANDSEFKFESKHYTILHLNEKGEIVDVVKEDEKGNIINDYQSNSDTEFEDKTKENTNEYSIYSYGPWTGTWIFPGNGDVKYRYSTGAAQVGEAFSMGSTTSRSLSNNNFSAFTAAVDNAIVAQDNLITLGLLDAWSQVVDAVGVGGTSVAVIKAIFTRTGLVGAIQYAGDIREVFHYRNLANDIFNSM